MTTEKTEPVADDFDGIGWREYMRGIENGNIDPTGVRLRAVCKTARENLEALASDAQSVRAATIEECAKVAERAWPRAHTYASENADTYRAQDHAVRTVVKAIRALSETKPAQGAKLATLVLEYARDLRRNSSGGDDYPWEYAKATADYLEELVRRSETNPAQGGSQSVELADGIEANALLGSDEAAPVLGLLQKSRELNERQRWYLAECIANEIGQHLIDDSEPVEGYARSILRDIISIARDAQATDALGDIIRRAEEELTR